MRLAARFAQRWRCSSVSADDEEKNDDCGVRSRTREVWTVQRRCDPAGHMERWRAEPPDKQRAPGRVLFERDVERRPRRLAFTYSPRPPLQPNLQTTFVPS